MANRNNKLMGDIAKRILARRTELNLTQEQAADMIGLSRPFYACIERGEKGIGADSIVKICRAFSLSADYLLIGSMPPEEHQYVNRMMELLSEEQRAAACCVLENLLFACGYRLPEK